MIKDEELRNSADYIGGQKEAAHRILLELVNLFQEYQKDIRIVGRWVPDLMFPKRALLDYIEGPRAMIAMKAVFGDENALFFALQKKRISVHAVENLVEKYANEFVPQKKITPHKLRSTFGTNFRYKVARK